MKYRYFVSFICENELGCANGDGCLELNTKIKTNEDLKSMRKQIEESKNVKKVIFTSVNLLNTKWF